MEKGLSGLRGRDFELSDVFYFSKKGLEAIVEDEVTQRFSSEELVSWNLLTRTNINFQYISLRLTMVWVLGVIVRYCVLLPLRYVSCPVIDGVTGSAFFLNHVCHGLMRVLWH